MRLNTLKADGFTGIKWCGPTALAIISGRTLKFCHNKLARLHGTEPRYLKGVWNGDMMAALREMKFHAVPQYSAYGMTLRKYIEEVQTTKQFRGVMLVNITNHYVVISRGMVVDNRNGSEPLPVRDHPMWRKKIKRGWLIKRRK